MTNDHPVLWDISKDGPWMGSLANQKLWDSRVSRVEARGLVIDDSEVAILTKGGSLPLPHWSDRFSCDSRTGGCGKYWRRSDGDYHRERNYEGRGGSCRMAPVIEYVHPWPTPPEPPPVPQLGSGSTRGGRAPLAGSPTRLLEPVSDRGHGRSPLTSLGRLLLRLAALCGVVAP